MLIAQRTESLHLFLKYFVEYDVQTNFYVVCCLPDTAEFMVDS